MDPVRIFRYTYYSDWSQSGKLRLRLPAPPWWRRRWRVVAWIATVRRWICSFSLPKIEVKLGKTRPMCTAANGIILLTFLTLLRTCARRSPPSRTTLRKGRLLEGDDDQTGICRTRQHHNGVRYAFSIKLNKILKSRLFRSPSLRWTFWTAQLCTVYRRFSSCLKIFLLLR